MTDPRSFLREVYGSALAAVDGRRLVARTLGGPPRAVAVLAIGKAAPAMFAGAASAPGLTITHALVITGASYVPADRDELRAAQVVTGGHPVPDETSLAAGDALLRFLADLPPDEPLLILLSGGASAMVERLPDGVGLEDLARLNGWLLGSGFDIGDINKVRRAASAIKGGRLAPLLRGRPAELLIISDVPGDHLHDIGSGPFSPVPAETRRLPPNLPDWIETLVRHAPPMPAADDPAFAAIGARIIANNGSARAAAANRASAYDLKVYRRSTLVSEEAEVAGTAFADTLLRSGAGLHIWGGEPAVTLPPDAGQGGRCQHFALAAAQRLSGAADVHVLAAGSDGSDGGGAQAGALVDGGSVARGRAAGLDPADCLRRADAGRFLAASGDLLPGAATGTNVMDLMFGLKS
jgi:hydroxypyruvate reductase